jgi:hypothetical protein
MVSSLSGDDSEGSKAQLAAVAKPEDDKARKSAQRDKKPEGGWPVTAQVRGYYNDNPSADSPGSATVTVDPNSHALTVVSDLDTADAIASRLKALPPDLAPIYLGDNGVSTVVSSGLATLSGSANPAGSTFQQRLGETSPATGANSGLATAAGGGGFGGFGGGGGGGEGGSSATTSFALTGKADGNSADANGAGALSFQPQAISPTRQNPFIARNSFVAPPAAAPAGGPVIQQAVQSSDLVPGNDRDQNVLASHFNNGNPSQDAEELQKMFAKGSPNPEHFYRSPVPATDNKLNFNLDVPNSEFLVPNTGGN